MTEKVFNLQEYKKNSIKPKLRYFFEYMELKFAENGIFDNGYFELLGEEQFLESLEYYIEKASPARQSAQDYRRDLIEFFEMLRTEYGIRNAVFFDNEIFRDFEKSFKDVIQQLKEQENKQCLSDELFETLEDEIKKFINISGLEELIINDIENNYLRTEKKSRYYSRFVSILPIKLAMKYGLGNKTMASIQIGDLDLKQKVLQVNGFSLPLDSEMVELFDMYERIREKIIELNMVQTNFLFVKMDGSSFIMSHPSNPEMVDAAGFFFFMDSSINTTAGKKLSYRKIVELVQRGADIDTLSLLVDVTSKTIRKLCQVDDNSLKENIQTLFIGNQKIIEKKDSLKRKGMMQCSFCGKFRDAVSDNWMLIQMEGETRKYLACRECEGKDGKYRY